MELQPSSPHCSAYVGTEPIAGIDRPQKLLVVYKR
jgi:hypothetical protein